ncbi:hypothetical protein Pst134EA_031970 [Puccinia striiformis f. sp. tritici]|uniref:uncharacterized protein n=1 Tax=Puccinia striiformis f. sp. tritici TaxID=168172 RepID=UPI002007328A|nr:uncharacterized protein Pst134EA_031970 [Puccinia striiformis f. sp. tritici]KAH9442551.1 hypothetical protein Pst134EA_031970 [Puccinia striiformis f. sp. tritici]
MRVSCLFVTVAIMLVGENQSLPLERRQGVPLVSTLGSTTKGIQGKPILGSLGLDLYLGSNDGAAPVEKYANGATKSAPVSGPSSELPSAKPLPSKAGYVNGASPDTKNAASGVKVFPVSGPTSKIPSVNQGPTYQASPLSGAQPKVNNAATEVSKILPASGLPATAPSVTQAAPSKLGSTNGALPDTKSAASVVSKVLPVPGPTSKVPSANQGPTYQASPSAAPSPRSTAQRPVSPRPSRYPAFLPRSPLLHKPFP